MSNISCDSDDAIKLVPNCKDGYVRIGDSYCAKISPFVPGALTIIETDRVTFNSVKSDAIKSIPATSILECVQEIIKSGIESEMYGIKLYPQNKQAIFFAKSNISTEDKVGASSSLYPPYPAPEDLGGEKIKNLKDLDTVKKHNGYSVFRIIQPKNPTNKNSNTINIQYESCSKGEIFVGSCKGDSTTYKYSISDIYFEQSQIPLIQSNTQGVECRKELVYASPPWKSGSGTAPNLMFEWCNEHQDLNICKRYCDQYPDKCQVTPTKDLILLGTALILLIFIVLLIVKGIKIRASMPIIKKTPVKVSASSLGRNNNSKKWWNFDSSKPNNWWVDKTKGDSSKPKEISGKPKEKFSFKKLFLWFADKKLWFLWTLVIIMIVVMIIILIISIKGLYGYFTKPFFHGSDSDYKQSSSLPKDDKNLSINYDNLYSWQNMHGVSTNVKTRCEKGIPYYKPGDKNYNSDWKYGYNYPQQCIINYCTNSTGYGNVPDNKVIKEGTQSGDSCCYGKWTFSNGGCFQPYQKTYHGSDKYWNCCSNSHCSTNHDSSNCRDGWHAFCHGDCAGQTCKANCCSFDKGGGKGFAGGTPYDANSTLPYSVATENNTWKQFNDYASAVNPSWGVGFCFNESEMGKMNSALFPSKKLDKSVPSVASSVMTCDKSQRGYCLTK